MKKFLENINRTDVRNIIAILYTLLVLVFIYVLAFKAVPDQNKDLVNVLGGGVFSGVGVILGFYFGSSKADKESHG
ncbi:MAG: hypothetical protein ABS68_00230 [Niastella sp. SCN 39-18]|nr:hypothetical protein [Sphingobacteriales bacterium]ODT55178.1 MAG: hypothetical protein ABS68_00230 [Niastella sp. SCN 39-18]OJW09110.1 MAG: hypothetical protein BGO53_00175 [Sphingobacteriales bacterium 39-19]